jgi:hypothetical protein
VLRRLLDRDRDIGQPRNIVVAVAWSANAPDIALRKAPSALRLRAGPDVISVPSVALTARRNARNQSGLIFQSGGNEFSIGLRATAIVSDRW